MKRRLFKTAFLMYVGAGIYGLYLEQQGVLQCNCEEDCWCKQPGLNVFRWVQPTGHKLKAGDHLPA